MNEALDRDRKVAAANEQRWDKWFDEKPGRKFVHTLSWDPAQLPKKVPVTTVLPPQFGPTPAPGMKIYVGDFPNGQWANEYVVTSDNPSKGTTRVVGVSVPRDPVNAEGTNLFFDDPPAPHFPARKRNEDEEASLNIAVRHDIPQEFSTVAEDEWESTNLTAIDKRTLFTGQLVRRQNTGGFLDAHVYTNALFCPLELDSTTCDFCEDWEDAYLQYGQGDGITATYTVTGTVTGPGATGISGNGSPPGSTDNTRHPSISQDGKVYPGQFEFFYYSAYQYGPQNTVIAEHTGILGFNRPTGTNWKACLNNEVYTTSATSQRFPDSLDNIRVYDSVCSYRATQDEHSAHEGDVVGTLSCSSLADAKCTRRTKDHENCDTLNYFSLVLCSWE